jgi:hypothetical protein
VGNFACPLVGKRTKEERLHSESDELREGKGDSHFFSTAVSSLFNHCWLGGVGRETKDPSTDITYRARVGHIILGHCFVKHSSALILSNNDGDPDLTIPSLRTTLTASAKSRKNVGLFVFFDFRASFLTTFVAFFWLYHPQM